MKGNVFKKKWGIQTVYLPRENLPYLEEWLAWHSYLGASYFYLYDNTGSHEIHGGNCLEINQTNKQGFKVDFTLSDDEVIDLEKKIISKYPVEKIIWQPKVNGKIVHQAEKSYEHFSDLVKDGWCAFIDIDEFINPHQPLDAILTGKVVRFLQKKFRHRAFYKHTLDCCDSFCIDTYRWGSKLFINMQYFEKNVATDMHDIVPYEESPHISPNILCFNHYNHADAPLSHQWLLDNCDWIDSSWQPKSFEDVFDHFDSSIRDISSKVIDYSKFVEIPYGYILSN